MKCNEGLVYVLNNFHKTLRAIETTSRSSSRPVRDHWRKCLLKALKAIRLQIWHVRWHRQPLPQKYLAKLMLSVVILQRNIKQNDHIDPFYFKLLLPMKPPWPTRNHRQQQLPMPMGPHETIGNSCDIFDGPMRSHRQQQLHMPTGPCETIGNSSCLFRWAHAKPSTEAAAYANGPMRYHRQQQQHMPMGPHEAIDSNSCIDQWAHAIPFGNSSCLFRWAHRKKRAAVADGSLRAHRQKQLRMPMGPCDTIGSSSRIYRWAHAKPSATAAAYFDGPMRSHRQQWLHMPMGPCETIGNNSCIFQWAHAWHAIHRQQ